MLREKQTCKMSALEAARVASCHSSSFLDAFTSLFDRQHFKSSMVRKMVTLAAPCIVGNVLWFGQQAIAQSYIGRRLGDEALAQFSVGVSTFNIFGLSFGIGLASALDTLASQAYGRNKKNNEIGELFQRSLLLDVLLTLPILLVFYNIKPLMGFLYGERLAEGAMEVLRSSYVYLPLNMFNNSFAKILQAQNLPALQLYASITAVIVCWIASHFLIVDSLSQAVWALTLTHVAFLAHFVVASITHPDCALRYATWPISSALWDWEEMKLYLRLGIPSLISLCSEWWAFEILFVFAARVSDFQVTVLSVVLSTASICFSVAFGVSIAGSVSIGNALGEGNAAEAKAYSGLCLLMDQAVTLVTVAVIASGRWWIPQLYSSDERVIAAFSSAAHLVALFHWCDSSQFTLQGIFRGAGKQDNAARIVLFSLWGVGLPICWYLGVFHVFGTPGILLGLMSGFSVEVPLLMRDMVTWDWEAMATTASLPLSDVAHGHALHGMSEEEDHVQVVHSEKTPLLMKV